MFLYIFFCFLGWLSFGLLLRCSLDFLVDLREWAVFSLDTSWLSGHIWLSGHSVKLLTLASLPLDDILSSLVFPWLLLSLLLALPCFCPPIDHLHSSWWSWPSGDHLITPLNLSLVDFLCLAQLRACSMSYALGFINESIWSLQLVYAIHDTVGDTRLSLGLILSFVLLFYCSFSFWVTGFRPI